MVKKSVDMKQLLKNNLMSVVLFFSVIVAVGVIAGDVIVQDGQVTLENDFIVNVSNFFVDVSVGSVGIGNLAPLSTLDVTGDVRLNDALRIDKGGSIFVINSTSGTTTMNVVFDHLQLRTSRDIDDIYFTVNAGNALLIEGGTAEVGIGTINPSVRLHVEDTSIDNNIFRLKDSDGTCDYNPESGSVTVTCSSDEGLKTDIVNAPSLIDKFMDIIIREYTVRESGDKMIGVIAQEIELTNPEMVHDINSEVYDEGTDTTTINTVLGVEQPTTWELVKIIQEQQQMINDLKSRLDSLEGK